VDLKFHAGEVFVAGVSNQESSSTLRRIPYPFTGAASETRLEIYHLAHGIYETRAPIRAMQFATIDGEDTLIAAYACSPLVTIPVSELKHDAKVRGKTIGDMGNGQPVSMVAYRDGDGDKLFITNLSRGPFLVLPHELWPVDGRRLTVLMEPGRIKRGLGADPSHEPALVVGRTYSLVVTALGQTARHAFRVSDPVLQAVDETRWRLVSPTAGSLDPAVVHFDRVMDAALCEDEIGVLTPAGELAATRVSLAPDGTAARLIPSRPWLAGEHRLVVSERLEDVGGNRLGEALDHDLGAGGPPRAGMINFTTRAVPSQQARQPRR
jgi:hypothetical protein